MLNNQNTILTSILKYKPVLSIGMISANQMNLGADLAALQSAGAQMLHFDVMDGKFAPMLTIGPFYIKSFKSPLIKDVHLMIEEPLDSIKDYAAAGADIITVHVESCRHVHRCLQVIGECANVNYPESKILRGIALNPGTPVETIEPLIDFVDMVCLLAINPGFGGQKFLASTKSRLQQIKQIITKSGRSIITCIDGGISKATIAEVAELKPDIIVSGSAIFENNKIKENYAIMTSFII